LCGKVKLLGYGRCVVFKNLFLHVEVLEVALSTQVMATAVESDVQSPVVVLSMI
jgi:hypothetical protein